jgi:SAM-dependent methyltransferase
VTPISCRICGNSEENRIHIAREMMFGTRDEFNYLECAGCGTVQIVEVPELGRYYPPDYYSLSEDKELNIATTFRRRLAAKLIGKHLVTGRSWLGARLAARRPYIVDEFPRSLREPILRLRRESRVLDFGCGYGQMLQTLHYFGFRHLTGADAFIETDIIYPFGVKILKRTLAELEPAFDLIMLHHSFEHLPDPRHTLSQLHRLLDDDGAVLIRLPLASFAWEKYGVNWVQLDPPRHLFLYTEKSFRQLIAEAGFDVVKVVYDSEAFQFFGSERYLMNIPMNDPRSFRGPNETNIFSQKQFDDWILLAQKLNAEGRGDQACFYLRKLHRVMS